MENLWPLVILWVLFSVLGGKKKRPGARAPGPASTGSSLTDRFAAALEELKRAELEAAQGAAGIRQRTAGARLVPERAGDDESSEDISTVEGVADYDDEASRIADARRKLADRTVDRRAQSVEELTPQQRARRAERTDVAIGGRVEHDAWHMELMAKEAAPEQRRGSDGANQAARVLRRYGDGSVKGALVLSEILGRPRGEQ